MTVGDLSVILVTAVTVVALWASYTGRLLPFLERVAARVVGRKEKSPAARGEENAR